MYYLDIISQFQKTKTMLSRKRSKNYRFSGLFLLFLLFAGAAQAQDSGSYVKNEILVKFTGGLKSSYMTAANLAIGSEVMETLGDLGWQRIRIPDGMTIDEAIGRSRVLAPSSRFSQTFIIISSSRQMTRNTRAQECTASVKFRLRPRGT